MYSGAVVGVGVGLDGGTDAEGAEPDADREV
jgi:hypothetical protein